MKKLNNFTIKKHGIIFLTCILLTLSASTFSASISWDAGGGTNNDWSNPLNWSGDVLPGATDQVTITGGYTIIVSTNVGSINKLVLNTSTGGAPKLSISNTGKLTVQNSTTTNQNQLAILGGILENSGEVTIVTGGNSTNNTGNGLVLGNGTGSFVAAATYYGTGILNINTTDANNTGACINLTQTNANPVFTVGGTYNLVATTGKYAILVNSGTNAIINGSGELSAGTNNSLVNYGLLSINSTSLASTLTIESGVTLNSYSTGFSINSAPVFLGNSIGNNLVNKGTINIGGSGNNGIYCVPNSGTNTFNNIGSISITGTFANSSFRIGGTGTTNFTNSGIVFIDNIASTGNGIGMSAAPTVNINNTGNITLDSNGTNIIAINLGDSKSIVNNTGSVRINKGSIAGTAGGVGKAQFNNNTSGVFVSNVGSSNSGVSTDLLFTNSGGIFEGSCTVTEGSFVPSTGTISPGGSNAAGIITFYTALDGGTFNLTGRCIMNINGITGAGIDYDKIMTTTPLSTLDVSDAILEIVLGESYVRENGNQVVLFSGDEALTGVFSNTIVPANCAIVYSSKEASLLDSISTGINDVIEKKTNVKVVNQDIIVANEVGSSIFLYNMAGQLIKFHKITSNNELIHLDKGLYLIKTENEVLKVLLK